MYKVYENYNKMIKEENVFLIVGLFSNKHKTYIENDQNWSIIDYDNTIFDYAKEF